MRHFRLHIAILAAAALLGSGSGASAQSSNFLLGKWTETHAAILKELSESYVDSLPVDEIERKGIDAMLAGLDPYTAFIPAEENEDLQMMIQKAYGGIGAVIYKPDVDGNVIINEPYAGSPASKYGLSCGDEILSIDGETVHGLTSQQCSDKMKGDPGTSVNFSVKKVHSGDTVDVKVVRERIRIRHRVRRNDRRHYRIHTPDRLHRRRRRGDAHGGRRTARPGYEDPRARPQGQRRRTARRGGRDSLHLPSQGLPRGDRQRQGEELELHRDHLQGPP